MTEIKPIWEVIKGLADKRVPDYCTDPTLLPADGHCCGNRPYILDPTLEVFRVRPCPGGGRHNPRIESFLHTQSECPGYHPANFSDLVPKLQEIMVSNNAWAFLRKPDTYHQWDGFVRGCQKPGEGDTPTEAIIRAIDAASE